MLKNNMFHNMFNTQMYNEPKLFFTEGMSNVAVWTDSKAYAKRIMDSTVEVVVTTSSPYDRKRDFTGGSIVEGTTNGLYVRQRLFEGFSNMETETSASLFRISFFSPEQSPLIVESQANMFLFQWIKQSKQVHNWTDETNGSDTWSDQTKKKVDWSEVR